MVADSSTRVKKDSRKDDVAKQVLKYNTSIFSFRSNQLMNHILIDFLSEKHEFQ